MKEQLFSSNLENVPTRLFHFTGFHQGTRMLFRIKNAFRKETHDIFVSCRHFTKNFSLALYHYLKCLHWQRQVSLEALAANSHEASRGGKFITWPWLTIWPKVFRSNIWIFFGAKDDSSPQSVGLMGNPQRHVTGMHRGMLLSPLRELLPSLEFSDPAGVRGRPPVLPPSAHSSPRLGSRDHRKTSHPSWAGRFSPRLWRWLRSCSRCRWTCDMALRPQGSQRWSAGRWGEADSSRHDTQSFSSLGFPVCGSQRPLQTWLQGFSIWRKPSSCLCFSQPHSQMSTTLSLVLRDQAGLCCTRTESDQQEEDTTGVEREGARCPLGPPLARLPGTRPPLPISTSVLLGVLL